MENEAKMDPKWCHQAPKMKPERSKIEAIWDEKEVCSPNRLQDSWGNKSPYRYQSGQKELFLLLFVFVVRLVPPIGCTTVGGTNLHLAEIGRE